MTNATLPLRARALWLAPLLGSLVAVAGCPKTATQGSTSAGVSASGTATGARGTSGAASTTASASGGATSAGASSSGGTSAGTSAGTGTGSASSSGGTSAGATGTGGTGTGSSPLILDAGPLWAPLNAPIPDAGIAGPNSVLQHHNAANRSGSYFAPELTKAAVADLHLDPTFNATIDGAAFAQPLYFENGPGNQDLVIVVTENNEVSALLAAGGLPAWRRNLGPAPALSDLPCGNIDPYGITGTPVIDGATRTLYVDSLSLNDAGVAQHFIYALSIDDGSTLPGWPVSPEGLAFDGGSFLSPAQGERGALLLFGGALYVPYGGLYGDCLPYNGWVVGVPLRSPSSLVGWSTPTHGGGIWGPGGLTSDGTWIYATTGNAFNKGPKSSAPWGGSEAMIRFNAASVFTGSTTDFWAAPNWFDLDASDTDVSGSGNLPIDVPGATPSALLAALAKDGNIYLADRNNLGGFVNPTATYAAANGVIITSGASYATGQGSYLVMRGSGAHCPSGAGDLISVRITPDATSGVPTVSTAWCQNMSGAGSPIETHTDGGADGIVWSVGAGSSNKLYGFDADTGAWVLSDGGIQLGPVARFATPIVAKGRIYVAGVGTVYALEP